MPSPTEDMIDGASGKLFTRIWRPVSPPRGGVVICHGFNAHSGYYSWAAEQFGAYDLAVYALDLRGRGRSEGERFYVDSIDDYADDVSRLIAKAKMREPGLPIFLLGHSAGGVTSVIYALDHPNEIAGLICESFAYRVPAPDFALAVLKGLAHVAPHAHAVELKNSDFSRNADHVRRMDADPLIHGEKQSLRTMSALVHADERLKREFSRITLPLLIMHGADDKSTRPDGSREFFEEASSADKTLKIYDGRYHDLLNDKGREEVMADLIAWLDRQIISFAKAKK